MRTVAFFIVACALGFGCAHQSYVYEPAEQATAMSAGYPAARYTIPPESPRGDVRIASFGIAETQAAGGPKVPVLHLRMMVANDSDDAVWRLDTREQWLALAGVGTIPPLTVNTDAGAPPLLEIPKGQARTLDLYFALPPGRQRAEALPSFELIWNIDTGLRRVAERTPFERAAVERVANAYSDAYPTSHFGLVLGYSPYWYSDPFFPRVYPRAAYLHHYPRLGVPYYHAYPSRRMYLRRAYPPPPRSFVARPPRIR